MEIAGQDNQKNRGTRLGPSAFSQSLRRADSALKSGGAAEAKQIVQSLVGQDLGHVGALELLAKAQWTLGENEELLETLTVLTRINPYEPGYHLLRGNSLRNLGRYGEALRAFVRAGDADGARDAVAELSALQSNLVLQLLDEDRVFRAQYAQDPDRACAARGFEFRSETKIRDWTLTNEFNPTRLTQRPS
jgi:Flp pilus assembly protein TadD